MASLQEPEVQLAQRLASNQKPIRTRAMKKLRKYVQVRSQKVGGGFTLDELLKLWKGLFYCLWMQDKPLLQMDLSKLIAAMIHNFHDLDAPIYNISHSAPEGVRRFRNSTACPLEDCIQVLRKITTDIIQKLLYLRACLQTFKREWNGIDRLRMDKFFQLVRYMFHQSFELLRRKTWDSRGVDGFLQVVNDELLRSGCEAPSGLQIHVLDVYLTELAAVGAQELNADQNLQFIKPFCRIAAETKNKVLFKSICNNIFSTIASQAPFAIEDLIQELKRGKNSALSQDSDSGQASDEGMDSEDQVKIQKKESDQNITVKQMNGIKPPKVDEDDLMNLEDSEVPPDEDDICAVLQFDYGAIADKLLELACRQKVPSCNRKKLYQVIKTFRNLSEGIFPQEYRPGPQQPSSDEEDDEMLDSRNILKRAREMLGVGDGVPAAKKKKKKKRRKKKGLSPADGLDLEEGGDDEAEQETGERGKEKEKKKTKLIDDQQNSEVKERGPGQTPVESSQDQTHLVDLKKEPMMSSLVVQLEAISDTAAKGGRKKKKMKIKKKEQEEDVHTGRRGVLDATVSQPTETTSAATKTQQTHSGPSLQGEVESCTVTEEILASANIPVKRNKCLSVNAVEAEGCESEEGMPGRKKRKREVRAHEVSLVETQPNADKRLGQDTPSMSAMRRRAAIVPETGGGTSGVSCTVTKRKIPVVIEFEADDVANGAGKLTDPVEDVAVLKPMNSKRKTKPLKSGFVTFQEKSRAPTPLFCRTKAGQEMPKTSKKVKKVPKSESKKVTFHLLKNQTAEFRKSDRSLLLSPHGPTRVAFDPEQKPKSGVLKSPPTPDTTCTLSARRKTTADKSRRRPSAADFF